MKSTGYWNGGLLRVRKECAWVRRAWAHVGVDSIVIISKRNEDSGVILLKPKEREWNH